MKVKDVIKLTDDNTEVMIYEKERCMVCVIDGECWGECNGCEHFQSEAIEWEKYCGTAENVPIKVSERTIKEISVRERITRRLKRKNETNWFLAIRVKEEQTDCAWREPCGK